MTLWVQRAVHVFMWCVCTHVYTPGTSLPRPFGTSALSQVGGGFITTSAKSVSASERQDSHGSRRQSGSPSSLAQVPSGRGRLFQFHFILLAFYTAHWEVRPCGPPFIILLTHKPSHLWQRLASRLAPRRGLHLPCSPASTLQHLPLCLAGCHISKHVWIDCRLWGCTYESC